VYLRRMTGQGSKGEDVGRIGDDRGRVLRRDGASLLPLRWYWYLTVGGRDGTIVDGIVDGIIQHTA
jgi:hypothetical protein